MSGKGFTLTEVLVVITIVAVIGAIVYPVFSGARRRASELTCSSNLHQLGLATLMYQADHGGGSTYGTTSAMGLPPDGDAITAYAKLPHAIWKCAGAPRIGLPYALYCYMASTHGPQTGEWEKYAISQESQAVLYADFNHRNEGKPWLATYMTTFAMGWRLDGHMSYKNGHGTMCGFDFWTNP